MRYDAAMKMPRAEPSREKALRLVAIYRLLLAGPATRAQIIEALRGFYGENAHRAVRRDLEALAGRPFAELASRDNLNDAHAVELHHDPVTDQISLLTRDALLRLHEREWAALDLVERAFPPDAPHAKDVQALTERVRNMAEPNGRFRFPVDVSLGSADAASMPGDILEKIEQAMRQRQRVAFQYRGLGRNEHRVFDAVELLHLTFRDGHYYLQVHEPQGNRSRTLRMDRIVAESWRLLPHVVRDRAPTPTTRVRYRLDSDLASGGVSERLAGQRVEHEANGGAVVTGDAPDLFCASRLVLGYGSKAEALAPPQLREMVAREVARMAELYRDQAHDGGKETPQDLGVEGEM